ncbi:MAG: 1-deoxy-D-xylulose-5-phosphate reductoisomerase [Ottowia sp.]|nr:1-deoxy-D-xylulose-5-phosphate reductoisomerase [Ottowia sp.]
MQRVAVLGSTGSVGCNTLDVIARHPDRFEVVALTAATRVEKLLEQCLRFRPQVAVMAGSGHAARLERKLRARGLTTQVMHGERALEQVASDAGVDTVMAAIVGAAGLSSTLAAARAGKRLLLANKEALVVGGELFLAAVRDGGATLLPIDSEHSAIFQALPQDRATWPERVDKIILTASGGPFLRHSPAELAQVTPEQACAHPTWVMGPKISVDSATMMNKALEVVEAHYLFGLAPASIEVVLHPQSVVHSMVQYSDKSVLAQLGTPDMRVPIAYGLAWPGRMASGAAALDFGALRDLSFEPMDSDENRARFPALALAWEALAAPPGTCAVLNAANEVAVAAFLARRIRFDQIHAVIHGTLAQVAPGRLQDLPALLALDTESRATATSLLAHLRQ